MIRARSAFAAACAALLLMVAPGAGWAATPVPALPPLTAPQKAVLTRYLTALHHANYTDAFALLSKGEQSYFKDAANFASIFTADRLTLNRFAIAGAAAVRGNDAMALVNQNVTLFDPVHGNLVTANASARYGLISEGGTYRIRDLFHPWKSFVPSGATATKDRYTVTVRKVSFFPDRIELVVTFANTGETAATAFPYGRSVMRDERGRAYPPVPAAAAAHVDNDLYLGLRLPLSGQYTGIVAFKTPEAQASPRQLTISIAPVVREGGDEPLQIDLPPVQVPG